MTRTPEQAAADDTLTAAIENHQAAYHDDNEGVLTDYLVIAQRTFWDEDGDQCQAVYLSVRDGNMGLSQQLGLITFADTLVRKNVTDGD
jgi:hypothetical protein